MPPVGFEPKISAGERPQTYAFDRADSGIGVKRGTNEKAQITFLLVIVNKKSQTGMSSN
jgi:hypothetical protein